MDKRLFPAVIAAAALCALLAVLRLQNPAFNSGNQEQAAQAQEQAVDEREPADQQDAAEQGPEADEQGPEADGQSAEVSEQSTEANEQNADTDGQAAQYKPLSVTETEEYTEKIHPVVGTELAENSAPVRFYKESPNVPYMGIGKYFDLMLGGGLQVQPEEDGTITLTNTSGAQAVVDIAGGTVSSKDMPAFENYLDEAREGRAGSFKDSDAPYLRLREVVYDGTLHLFSLNLGNSGLHCTQTKARCGSRSRSFLPG